jgi:hypothetical protein
MPLSRYANNLHGRPQDTTVGGMSESDPAIPPVVPSEVHAVNPPEVGFLEGTSIPELELERDAEWLGVILPRHVPLDNDIVAKLNFEANCSEGLATSRAFMQEQAKGTLTIGAAYMAPQNEVFLARRRFYKALLGGHVPPTARNGIEVAANSEKRPSQVIELTRAFYDVVGSEHFDEVVVMGRYLFRISNRKVFDAMHTIMASGVDLRAVLLESPNTVVSRSAPTEERLLELARAAQDRYYRKIAAVERGAGAIAMPTIKDPAEPLGVGLRNVHRYDELADVSDISSAMLQAAFPAVDRLDPEQFAELVQEVTYLADEDLDRSLRIRDITPFIPQQPKKQDS